MRGQRRPVDGDRELRGVVATEPSERAVARLAARQHGIVTRTQLIDLGLKPGTIDWRLRSGRLRALHRGVYLVGPVAPSLAREMAAALSCGPGAVVSHRSAAALWRLLPDSDGKHPGAVDVTVSGRDPGDRPGVSVHRVRRLGRDEVRMFHDVPITTPARTLLDVAAVVSQRRLEQAVAEAQRRGLADARRLLDLVARYPTRRGSRTLRLLVASAERPALTRSQAEERFLALVRDAELPSPEVNAVLHGLEVDFVWREHGLVVEIDGYAYHSDRRAFEQDRWRDSVLAAHGYRVIRLTWRQLVDSPAAVVARVAQALSRGDR